ncbi:MAG: CBS domain-containing protein [Pseudarcicella sp.]|jgi:predicted transcriptional regulator|nr:CBS domain-containing protein [Pseudarcicella sp.]MBP6618626.1 CBS domain-containing protein [Leadbetterella sp.]
MIAFDFLNSTLPTLKPTDNVAKALEWMDEFHITQLPVADNSNYLGIVNYSTLLNSDENILLKNINISYSEIYINPEQHIYEVLALAQKYELESIALLDNEQKYTGFVLLNNIQKNLSFAVANTSEVGAIIEIEIENHQYSLAEISRLVEINGIKILSSFLDPKSSLIENSNILTLKLSTKDISKLLSTLERYEINVKNVYANEKINSSNKDRYDHLMKYLEI